MAKNFVQPGETLTLTAPSGGVVSGSAYLIGSLLVIALISAAETELFQGKPRGVWVLPKTNAQAWAEGVKVYWDNTNKVVTTTATDNTLVGFAVEAAANPSATGVVWLNN
ncbi:putative RecA/RadA family phage recombinase [Rhodoligotrophos appendicifer]|uniref:DUF2190 family protein n=1 Tax=Rhodoligotrophos appendicifer TaxID=987056 RepID=UPI001184AEA3|nr:DUF2190 family protein [Rhodoligotrophos appendicifer]